MFQISALCDIRNTIKDTPIHHLLVGSLEDMLVPDAYCMDSWCSWGFMFRISSLCDIRNTIKDPPIHHLLVGSLEDMLVPDAYCMDSWCPWGLMFQILALCDIRNTIKDPPIHHLLIGSLEDMAVSSTPLNWFWELPQICSSNVQNWSTVSSILMLYLV